MPSRTTRPRSQRAIPPHLLGVDLGQDDDPPFPFAIAGYALDGATPAAFDGAPAGLVIYHHQYGGLSCLQATWVGFGLVIPAAHRPAIDAVARAWSDTRGEPMPPGERTAWSTRLAAVFPAGIDTAHEALIVGTGPGLATLRGFPILLPQPPAPWRQWMALGSPDDVAIGDGLSDVHERALAALGEQLGAGLPRIAILWGNSD
jgi:hypothetical protein